MKNWKLNKADIVAVLTAFLGLLISLNWIGPETQAEVLTAFDQLWAHLGEVVMALTGIWYMWTNRMGTDNPTG